jgi:hypothetical protein
MTFGGMGRAKPKTEAQVRASIQNLVKAREARMSRMAHVSLTMAQASDYRGNPALAAHQRQRAKRLGGYADSLRRSRLQRIKRGGKLL